MDHISETLEALSSPDSARRASKHTHSLRGVRGVPPGEVARIAAAAFAEDPPRLPDDEDALDRLFGTAFEDGLVAVGLLAACLGDDPRAALDLGLEWAERTDDVTTADALGWLVLGPAALVIRQGALSRVIDRLGAHARAETRRAAVAMGLAMLPEPVEGPAAAPLRERVRQRHVRIVDAPRSETVARIASRFLRDEGPPVRKALRRLLRAWTAHDPESVVAWADGVRGGLPKMLRAETDRARRAAARADGAT